MSYGFQFWGNAMWGTGSNFAVINETPANNAINVSRTPIILFTLQSLNSNVLLNTITVIANGITLISDGLFTSNATGSIDASNPQSVNVTINVIKIFPSSTLITLDITAQNDVFLSLTPIIWEFTTNAVAMQFSNDIVRKHARVLTVNTAPLLHSTLTSLSITPTNLSISSSDSHQYTALGTFIDSSTADLTNLAMWTTSDVTIAHINSTGLLIAVSVGVVTITASVNGIIGTTSMTVT